MVHVIQTNPESPSLLSAKAICHLGDPNTTYALHTLPGLLTAQSHVTTAQPAAPSLYNSGLFSFLPNLSEQMLRPETWLGAAHFPAVSTNTTPISNNHNGVVYKPDDMGMNKMQPDANQCLQSSKNDPSYTTTTSSSVNEDDRNLTDSFHIFVGDLAPDVEDDVLHAAFAAFGNVTECKIIKDMHTQKPKGYGFVAYKNKHEAERAIQIMNGQIIGSRAIRTNWAVRRDPADQAKDHRPLNYIEVFNASSASNTTIYVGGITTGLTESLLHKAFEEFGEIKEVRIFRDKGFSFIRFDTHAAATRAIVTMHGRLVGTQSCKCSWGKEPTYSNRLHTAGSGVPKTNPILITSTFTDDTSRSTVLSGSVTGPNMTNSLSNLSIYPGWSTNFNSTSGVPLTKLDCVPHLNVYGNVLDSLSMGNTIDSLRTITADPYKLNPMEMAPDATKTPYWQATAKELESCLTTMVMTANSGINLPQAESTKLDIAKSAARATCGTPNLSGPEKYSVDSVANGQGLFNSTGSLERLGTLHPVHSIPSNGQPNIPFSCDLASPLVSETSTLPLHGLPPVTPGMLALKSIPPKGVLSNYPLLSNIQPYLPAGPVPISLSTGTTKLNLCDGTLHSAFPMNTLDPVTYALRSQQLMTVPLSLTDWTTNANSYGCGFMQPEIPRPALISNCNGVSLLC